MGKIEVMSLLRKLQEQVLDLEHAFGVSRLKDQSADQDGDRTVIVPRLAGNAGNSGELEVDVAKVELSEQQSLFRMLSEVREELRCWNKFGKPSSTGVSQDLRSTDVSAGSLGLGSVAT